MCAYFLLATDWMVESSFRDPRFYDVIGKNLISKWPTIRTGNVYTAPLARISSFLFLEPSVRFRVRGERQYCPHRNTEFRREVSVPFSEREIPEPNNG
jgi:hypothetical protein